MIYSAADHVLARELARAEYIGCTTNDQLQTRRADYYVAFWAGVRTRERESQPGARVPELPVANTPINLLGFLDGYSYEERMGHPPKWSDEDWVALVNGYELTRWRDAMAQALKHRHASPEEAAAQAAFAVRFTGTVVS